jgi:hypothetical protein
MTRAMSVTPHQRRMAELEATRALVADLEAIVKSSTVGTIPAPDLADVFERHMSGLPEGSQVRGQFERIASGLRKGSARTRVEGIRQIAGKLRRNADTLARQVEARDARLRARDTGGAQ